MWVSCGSGLRLSGILLRWSSGGSPLRPGLRQRGGCGCVGNVPEVLDWIRVLEMGWRVDNVECLQLCGTIQQQEAQHCPGPGPAWWSEACPGRSTGRYSAEVLHNLFWDSQGTFVKGTGVGCWRPCCRTLAVLLVLSFIQRSSITSRFRTLETQQAVQPFCRWTWEELQYLSNFCFIFRRMLH